MSTILPSDDETTRNAMRYDDVVVNSVLRCVFSPAKTLRQVDDWTGKSIKSPRN